VVLPHISLPIWLIRISKLGSRRTSRLPWSSFLCVSLLFLLQITHSGFYPFSLLVRLITHQLIRVIHRFSRSMFFLSVL
jgi:hypothetical protein